MQFNCLKRSKNTKFCAILNSRFNNLSRVARFTCVSIFKQFEVVFTSLQLFRLLLLSLLNLQAIYKVGEIYFLKRCVFFYFIYLSKIVMIRYSDCIVTVKSLKSRSKLKGFFSDKIITYMQWLSIFKFNVNNTKICLREFREEKHLLKQRL